MTEISELIARRRAELAQEPGLMDLIQQRRAELAPQVVTSQNGRTVAPGTTVDQAANIPPGMVFDPQTGGYIDAALAAERMGQGYGAVATYLGGTLGVGEYTDELIGKADSALTGDSPEIGQEIFRQSRQQFREARPVAATGLEIGSGVISSLPLAAGALGVAMKPASLGGRALTGASIGGGAGAVEGAISGYGAGETPEGRTQSAIGRGVVSGGLGLGLGAIAPALGYTAKGIVKRIKGTDVAAIADEFGVDRAAARVIKNALLNDDLDAAEAALQRLGGDAMLADAGLATGSLLDASMATGGRALSTARRRITARSSGASERLTQRLDDIIGIPTGIKRAARDISQRTSAARQTAYDMAYASPVNYADDAGRAIEETLSKVPPRTLRSAISEANEAMQAAGTRNMQIMAEISDDGAVRFVELPNVQQLDEIKKALGVIGRKEVDQFGRPTAGGLRATALARELREAVTEAVPEYGRAVRLGGDKIEEDIALQMGRDLLSRRATLEDVAGIMRGASDEARTAARTGLRTSIEETMSNVRRTITDPNVDVREAMLVVKEMSSRANMSKLRLVLGRDAADTLMDEINRAASALELRAMVAANSKTAIRQSIQEEGAAAVTGGPITALRYGQPVLSAQRVMQELTGVTDAALTESKREMFADIADALTGIQGPQAERAMSVVRKAMAGQPVKDLEAQFVARLIAAPAVSSAYQLGQKTLGPR